IRIMPVDGVMGSALGCWVKSQEKKACISTGFSLSGSTTWTRTRDPMINSHLLPVSHNGATKNEVET
ncbi:hypothetical protein, partial [Pseudomonas sp. PA-3-6E]|uniref:hypothetical protein n=1 Tax=Pseudomonas sp. PA-3-6E TaxID=2665474 RepID=UPI001F4006B7